MLLLLALLLAAPAPLPAAADAGTDWAKDLQPGHYYNKPGASFADYTRDWHACDAIASGAQFPVGTTARQAEIAAFYGIDAGLGPNASPVTRAALRRVNRRTCLLINGWRLIEPDEAGTAKLAAMSDSERNKLFQVAVGAADPPGRIIRWRNSFAAPRLAPPEAK
jgi:hypothetical protein